MVSAVAFSSKSACFFHEYMRVSGVAFGSLGLFFTSVPPKKTILRRIFARAVFVFEKSGTSWVDIPRKVLWRSLSKSPKNDLRPKVRRTRVQAYGMLVTIIAV